ncbi:RNA-directed DNA polymerase [Halomonas sp. M5N1S17]|uniref:antiviral reverse transcriptase Drt3b n=1 Tax=Halomonas alkalisoli TaxID=2907158 RepID=UPI001F2853B9|nr:antiviral reverse transcriptase Drt3b [Halomonas alkalisoli]MCE9663257.1 RNA-directed DNA polymerase [Halomonas alkalisoli]
MKRKIKLNYTKERALISDVLPYEIPLTFSNRHFYEFVSRNDFEYKNGVFEWRAKCRGSHLAIQILLGVHQPTIEGYTDGETSSLKLSKSEMTTIPFTYGITHKEDELRTLSFSHPRNQLKLVDFYNNHKNLMIYHCHKGRFSLRSPSSLARCVFMDNQARLPSGDEEAQPSGIIEEVDKEYRSLKSFFVYKKYSNIFKFFESKEYHQCEKKYNNMARLDISKCFDSIYTHSIAWSIFGKRTVKDVMSGAIEGGDIKGCFPDEFDELLQSENYGETNGILIGPESSRIFAEIILQYIDKEVLEELKLQNIFHESDYELFRYVDDYFVFYNDHAVYKKILIQLQGSLKQYKLNLNTEKEKIYQKPIITEITIAKKQISALLNDKLKYKIEESEEIRNEESVKVKHGNIFVRPSPLITEFKEIIKSSGVEYKDILNYSLAIVESKSKKIIDTYKEIEKTSSTSRSLVYAISSIIEFSFFIYSVSPRVNTTVKLARVLYVFISFLRTKESTRDDMNGVFKQIFENIYFITNKSGSKKYTQVETLYLLTVLSELGKDYRVEEEVIASFLGAKKKESVNTYQFTNDLNLFSITVALFYIRGKKRYNDLRDAIEQHIIERMESTASILSKDTERTVLFFDCLSCPYLSDDLKRHLLTLYGVEALSDQDSLIKLRGAWFTKWTDFDFGKELDAKRSLEVY